MAVLGCARCACRTLSWIQASMTSEKCV
jgi:hypothetical protein